ncbi:hypothetical protein GCM10022290_08870 [Sagittula marina]
MGRRCGSLRGAAAGVRKAGTRVGLERTGRFKRPEAYLMVESLPKNSNGKVLKTSLREMLAAS